MYNIYSLNPFFNGETKFVDNDSGRKKLHKKFVKGLWAVSFVFLLGIINMNAQTTLLNATGDGGFENAGTNGWTFINGSPNFWTIGTDAAFSAGAKAAYITNTGTNTSGGTYTYTTSNSAPTYSWMYRDFTIAAGQTNVVLNYKQKKPSADANDKLLVYIAPTTTTPVGNATPALGTYMDASATSTTTTIFTAATAFTLPRTLTNKDGATFRLIIGWVNDASLGTPNSPVAIDEISLVATAPATKTSNVPVMNWSTAASWSPSGVPVAGDNVVIAAGHTVTVDATITSTGALPNNVTVNGTLQLGSAANLAFTCAGDLTVANGGIVNAFNGTTGKRIDIGGNLVNNGTMDFSVTGARLDLSGFAPQTVSGTGTFTDSFIRTLNFFNNSAVYPNVTWNFNDIVTNSIQFGANSNPQPNRVQLGAAGTNRLFLGKTDAVTTTKQAGSFFVQGTSGFLPGAKLSRYFTAAQTGSSWGSLTDPTSQQGRFPFVTLNGNDRSAYIGRDITAATAGDLEVVYNDVAGITTGLSVTDGAYTINQRYNSNWSFAANNGFTSASYQIGLIGTNGLYTTNGEVRVMYANTAIGGSHQAGTITPSATRVGVSQADLTAAPLYMGIGTNDAPKVYSVSSGLWDDPSTWSTNTVPTISDSVLISQDNSILVSESGAVAKSLTIATGGLLDMSSPVDLTIGSPTTKNNSLINNGTINIADGTLNVNGYILSNPNASFFQSGGTIIVDGNDGNPANSVPTAIPLCKINGTLATLKLTGGSMRFLNPHIGAGSTDYVLQISNTGGTGGASASHTIIMGPDSNAPAIGGGYKQGFHFRGDSYVFGTVVVNSANGHAGRMAGGNVNGTTGMIDLIINSGGEYRSEATACIARNLQNNGTYTQPVSGSTIAMAGFTGSVAASPFAGSISGTGVWRNNDVTASSTANIHALTINNPNGVTLNTPLTMSGALTLSNGLLNTSSTNLLTMGNLALDLAGTAAATGTSTTAITSYVNGPLARVMPNGALNTNLYQYPVGKAGIYAPIWVGPSTNAAGNVTVSFDNVNAGIASATIQNLATTAKWNVDATNISNMNVRLQLLTNGTNTFTVAGKIPVSSATADGIYTNSFGSTATFASNAIQSNNAAPYNAFISYADPIACTTPNPGNTIASASTFCSGDKITLSLQNVTNGSGVTYLWQSSPDGSNWTNISGATAAAYTATPTARTYYRNNVTCSTGPETIASTAVEINPTNSITSTIPPARCGFGTVNLQGTANAGATVAWYNTATVGMIGEGLIGSGESFTTTTPINTNTIYYAAAETYSQGVYTILGSLPTNGTYSNQSSNGQIFNTSQPVTVQSIDVIPANTNTIYFVLATMKDNFNSDTILNAVSFTPTAAQANAGLPVTVPLDFSIPGSAVNYIIYTSLDATSPLSSKPAAVVRFTATSGTQAYPYIANGFKLHGHTQDGVGTNSRQISFFNWKLNGATYCASPRVPVTATVNASPALTLSTAGTAICKGDSSAAITITTNDGPYTQFTWLPATGVSGDEVNGWIFNPTATSTYTLWSKDATDTCGATATVVVTVNPLPPILAIPTPAIRCATEATTVALTATIVNETPAVWFPGTSQTQFPATPYAPATCDGSTANTISNAGQINDAERYALINVSAYHKYTFTTSRAANYLVVLDATGTNPLAAGLGSVVYYSSVAGQVRLYSYDNISGAFNGLFTYSKSVICEPMPLPIWSPLTDLYTDVAGTTAYTGEATATVYAKPSETTDYTATGTFVATGCSTDNEVTVNVASAPVAQNITQSVTTPMGDTPETALCITNVSKILTLGEGSIGNIVWQTVVQDNDPDETTLWEDIPGANTEAYTVNNPAEGKNWFRAKLSTDNNCSDPAAYSNLQFVYYDACLGLTDINGNAITVSAYPNPYSETFSLSLNSLSNTNIQIMVYDMTGRLINKREVAPHELSKQKFGDGYPTGVYNVIITQDNGVETLRMLKQ